MSASFFRAKCAGCSTPEADLDAPLKVCSRCKKTSYCSRQCQLSSWVHHKAECKALLSGGDPAPVRPAQPTPANEPRLTRVFVNGGGPNPDLTHERTAGGTRPMAPEGYAYAPSHEQMAANLMLLLSENLATLNKMKNGSPSSRPAMEMMQLTDPRKRPDGYLEKVGKEKGTVQIFDCFRLRMDDEYTYGQQCLGLYAGEDPLPLFKEFLDLAEKAKVMPKWYYEDRYREGMEYFAMDEGKIVCIKHIANKARVVQMHNEDEFLPHFLRKLADNIYGQRVELLNG